MLGPLWMTTAQDLEAWRRIGALLGARRHRDEAASTSISTAAAADGVPSTYTMFVLFSCFASLLSGASPHALRRRSFARVCSSSASRLRPWLGNAGVKTTTSSAQVDARLVSPDFDLIFVTFYSAPRSPLTGARRIAQCASGQESLSERIFRVSENTPLPHMAQSRACFVKCSKGPNNTKLGSARVPRLAKATLEGLLEAWVVLLLTFLGPCSKGRGVIMCWSVEHVQQ